MKKAPAHNPIQMALEDIQSYPLIRSINLFYSLGVNIPVPVVDVTHTVDHRPQRKLFPCPKECPQEYGPLNLFARLAELVHSDGNLVNDTWLLIGQGDISLSSRHGG